MGAGEERERERPVETCKSVLVLPEGGGVGELIYSRQRQDCLNNKGRSE